MLKVGYTTMARGIILLGLVGDLDIDGMQNTKTEKVKTEIDNSQKGDWWISPDGSSGFNSVNFGLNEVEVHGYSTSDKVKAFGKGFGKGFLKGLAFGLVVGALLAASSAILVVVGAAIAAYGVVSLAAGVYDLLSNDDLSSVQKAEGWGEITGGTIGGIVGGGSGYRAVKGKFRLRPTPKPKRTRSSDPVEPSVIDESTGSETIGEGTRMVEQPLETTQKPIVEETAQKPVVEETATSKKGKKKKKSEKKGKDGAISLRRMTDKELVDFFGDTKWHQKDMKPKFVKPFLKALKGDKNPDFYFDKYTNEVYLVGRTNGVKVKTGEFLIK